MHTGIDTLLAWAKPGLMKYIPKDNVHPSVKSALTRITIPDNWQIPARRVDAHITPQMETLQDQLKETVGYSEQFTYSFAIGLGGCSQYASRGFCEPVLDEIQYLQALAAIGTWLIHNQEAIIREPRLRVLLELIGRHLIYEDVLYDAVSKDVGLSRSGAEIVGAIRRYYDMGILILASIHGQSEIVYRVADPFTIWNKMKEEFSKIKDTLEQTNPDAADCRHAGSGTA